MGFLALLGYRKEKVMKTNNNKKLNKIILGWELNAPAPELLAAILTSKPLR